LPLARPVAVGVTGPGGIAAHAAILLEPRYCGTLINAILFSAATAAAMLATPSRRRCGKIDILRAEWFESTSTDLHTSMSRG
jgi:hypothetical protein